MQSRERHPRPRPERGTSRRCAIGRGSEERSWKAMVSRRAMRCVSATGFMQKASQIYGRGSGTNDCNSAAFEAAHIFVIGTVGEKFLR